MTLLSFSLLLLIMSSGLTQHQGSGSANAVKGNLMKEQEEPDYLWRECEHSNASNFYNKDFEVDNVFENDTINFNNYRGKVTFCCLDILVSV